MPEVTVRQIVDAPVDAVWHELADITRHVDWMADAAAIRFLDDQRAGVGTRFVCVTRLGPLRTSDLMEVIAWEEGREIAVRHKGVVRGEGRFVLRPAPTASGRAGATDPAGSAEPAGPADAADSSDSPTEVTWTEQLTFPWYLGGSVTATLAAPLLRWVWQGNLRRLGELVD